MLSDASLYSEHHNMQLRDTKLLLTSIISKMDWSRDQGELVMDIGCGPGDTTRNLLLPSLPEVKVLAIDILPNMIEYAKKNNPHPNIEYYLADIQERSTVAQWQNSVSKVISVYCFNWLKYQKRAFQNIYQVLKPGGEAALLFATSSHFWDYYKPLIENIKWNKYLKDAEQHVPDSHYNKYDSAHYKNMLENIGFTVRICEGENRTFIYRDDDACKAAFASRCALTEHIPSDLRAEFVQDLFEIFIKHNSRNSEGKIELHYTSLTLLLKKPTNASP